MAIGDGANDVSMIQAANVGIGVSGNEGRQAVLAADFAVPRFKALEKLLLVHGHWNYARLANMIKYFFFKNYVFVINLFWFQLFCGWSGRDGYLTKLSASKTLLGVSFFNNLYNNQTTPYCRIYCYDTFILLNQYRHID